MNLVYSIDEIVLVHLATYKREDRSNDLVCRKEKKVQIVVVNYSFILLAAKECLK